MLYGIFSFNLKYMICKICKKEYCEKEENNVCQNCSSSSVEYKNNINLKGTSL